MTYGLALHALADPTRRRIYESVRGEARAVGELARLVGVSQPAVSQHLRVLREARLVDDVADGRRRLYTARVDGLAELRRYVESLWDDALTAFAADDPDPPAQRGARGSTR